MTTLTQPGEVRSFGGINWTATEVRTNFSDQRIGIRWTAGHAAYSIAETDATIYKPGSPMGLHRFKVGSINCRSFEDAAKRALRYQAADYRAAAATLAKFESLPEIVQRAIMAY